MPATDNQETQARTRELFARIKGCADAHEYLRGEADTGIFAAFRKAPSSMIYVLVGLLLPAFLALGIFNQHIYPLASSWLPHLTEASEIRVPAGIFLPRSDIERYLPQNRKHISDAELGPADLKAIVGAMPPEELSKVLNVNRQKLIHTLHKIEWGTLGLWGLGASVILIFLASILYLSVVVSLYKNGLLGLGRAEAAIASTGLRYVQGIVQVLDARTAPYLVHWDTSARLETDSAKVMCVTKNLHWLVRRDAAGNKMNLIPILEDLKAHETNIYQYLVVLGCRRLDADTHHCAEWGVDQALETNISEIKTAMNTHLMHESDAVKASIKSRLIIRFLVFAGPTVNGFKSTPFIWDEDLKARVAEFEKSGVPLPLFSDLVMYDGFPSREFGDSHVTALAMMSKDPLERVGSSGDFDYAFSRPEQLSVFKGWFEAVWNTDGEPQDPPAVRGVAK